MFKMITAFTLAAISLSFSACGRNTPPPAPEAVVHDIKKHREADKPTIDGSLIPTIRVEITLNKGSIFGREFLYGADLQHSSLYISEWDLTFQSLAIGHIPAKFRISGSELQLVSDNSRLSPSDINHPEQLIARFKIVSQDANTLTVGGSDARVFLSQAFEGTHTETSGLWTNPAAPVAKDAWIRSLEFDPKGDYLLQETSIMMPDGSIGEFMEAIFPRDSLKPSAAFEKFEMDPDHPVGGDEGMVARFRFFGGEKNYAGEQAVTYAAHYDIGDGATIDWYATENTPDQYLSALKAGVEGWNRYFRTYNGIERDVVRFLGKLPKGVKIGDPRFNVINWDSRLQAGAAYESQATDPATGKQSHSLIYLPAAWVLTGMNYWRSGQFTELESAKIGFASCVRDLRGTATLAGSARFASSSEVEKFGRQLLIQTLFHEVGHALGLDHNFKGSLSFDRSDAASIFSTSIMDYNEFEVERAAFAGVDDPNGPLLEYDRQALSALYNGGRDLEGSVELPACNDAEADSAKGSIDPLCVRYDLERDPTMSIETALARIHWNHLEGDVSLTEALSRVPGLLMASEQIAKIASEEDFKQSVASFPAAVRGVFRFYIAGPQGLAGTVRANVRTLLVHAEGSLPEGYDAKAMRERVINGARLLTAFRELPANVKAETSRVRDSFAAKLSETPYIRSLSSENAAKAMREALTAIDKALAEFETDDGSGLPQIRATLYGELGKRAEVDFYFEKSPGKSADYENAVISLLRDETKRVSDSEVDRLAAATALKSFMDRFLGEKAIKAVIAALKKEREQAVNHKARSLAEKLLAVLK